MSNYEGNQSRWDGRSKPVLRVRRGAMSIISVKHKVVLTYFVNTYNLSQTKRALHDFFQATPAATPAWRRAVQGACGL